MLYTVLQETDLQLSHDQSRLLQVYRSDPTAKRIEIVRINLAALQADGFQVALLEGELLFFEREGIEERAPGERSWFGREATTDIDATLVVQGDDVLGTLQTMDNTYRIRSLGDGLHVVIQVDLDAMPPDHPPEEEPPDNPPG